MAVDALYCRLNYRGRKQYKGTDKEALVAKYKDYANIGLPAHKAAFDGDVDCLKEIFSGRKDEGVPSRDVNGATPLHLAVRKNFIEAVKWLVRFTDLSPLSAAKHGETPVHVAAAQGYVECLKALLAAEGKADFKAMLSTAVDNSGFTALHLSIVKHRNDCAKLLISELGSKAVNALNESGITAVHVAASAGNVEILKVFSQKYKRMLSQEAADGTTPVYFSSQEGRLEALKFLNQKCKCDINCPSNDGLKPIHAASQCGHTHIVKYIVSRLGNQAIFEPTSEGATPLHFATSTGKIRTASWLINSDVGGTLIVTKDRNGDSPAHDAAESGQTALLKLLLESGADLYAINNDGNTPYSLALSGGHMETANFVMTYASKSPQKDIEQEPSRMTIYDLQGEADVVDFNKFGPSVTGPVSPVQSQQQKSTSDTNANKEQPSGKKDKKKSKKGKGKDKANSSLLLESAKQTLQSFESEQKSGSGLTSDQGLDMTEEELAMFAKDSQKVAGEGENDIIVRYSGVDETEFSNQKKSPLKQAGGPTDYTTISELARSEERKERKKGRKISKSIQKALKPGNKKVNDSNKDHAVKKGFVGPEMGFKPQFRSNPLQRMSGSDVHIPPTPPPTPATGASIAPSDETAQHNLVDVEEEVEGGAYDMYAAPDPDGIRDEAEKNDQQEKAVSNKESENQKLLEDALDDLSGEDTPPQIPEQKLSSEEDEAVSRHSITGQPSGGSQVITSQSKGSLDGNQPKNHDPPPVMKFWPPRKEDEPQERPVGPKTKPAAPSVLRKWPPATGNTDAQKPPPKKPISVNKLPLASFTFKSFKDEEEQPTKPEPEPEPQPAAEPEPVQEQPPSPDISVKQRFTALKPVKRGTTEEKKEEKKVEVEFSKVKLKRAGERKGAMYSHPESETTSGANDELKKILQKKGL